LKLNPLNRSVPFGCALALAAALVCRAQDAASVAPAAPEPDPATVTAEPKPVPPADDVHKPFYKRMFSLEAVAATVPGSVIEQLDGWPGEWRRTRSGFEKRLGSLYGQFVLGALFEDGVKAIHAEDTRYRRLGKGNVFKRTGYVIAGTVAARKPGGGHTIAWSMAANAYGSWAVATLWSPRQYRSAVSILEWGTEGMGTLAGFNLAREFWPDVKGLFHKKK
jgi:hypothetical protein